VRNYNYLGKAYDVIHRPMSDSRTFISRVDWVGLSTNIW